MAKETIGEKVVVETADHPVRKDSAMYTSTRKRLMAKTPGGCYVCGGPAKDGDTSESKGMQDHHGGGIYVKDENGKFLLMGFKLFPMEWSEGWGANVEVLSQYENSYATYLGPNVDMAFDEEIENEDTAMIYVDSFSNANVKLCAPHHIGNVTSDTKDANGNQAVGIHNIPFPIFSYQAFCDWAHWDMYAGTTGTAVVAPTSGMAGHATLLHLDPSHPSESLQAAHKEAVEASNDGRHRHAILTPDHELSLAATKTSKYSAK